VREERNAYGILMRKPEEKDNLEDIDINRNIILYVILKELDGTSVLTGLGWLNLGKGGVLLWKL